MNNLRVGVTLVATSWWCDLLVIDTVFGRFRRSLLNEIELSFVVCNYSFFQFLIISDGKSSGDPNRTIRRVVKGKISHCLTFIRGKLIFHRQKILIFVSRFLVLSEKG